MFRDDDYIQVPLSTKLAVAMDVAVQGSYIPDDQVFDHSPDLDDRLPRYLSRIDRIDLNEAGGLYGVSLVAGQAGVGKSEMALGVGVEAAIRSTEIPTRNWRVIYINGELTRNELAGRFNSVALGHPEAYRAVDYIHVMHADPAHSHPADAQHFIEGKIAIEDTKLLIILDSINTLAKLGTRGSEGGYFSRMDEWLLWAKESARITEGKIAFLIVCEMNKGGGVRGSAQAEYWSNISLRLKNGHGEHEVAIECTKGRQGGRGDLGRYILDWRRGLFSPVVEGSGLTAINGGKVW